MESARGSAAVKGKKATHDGAGTGREHDYVFKILIDNCVWLDLAKDYVFIDASFHSHASKVRREMPKRSAAKETASLMPS